MKTFLISATLLSAAALSLPALAQPPSPAPSISVQYRDLDLNTPEGRAALRSRVNAAVRKVCAIRFDGGMEDLFGPQRCVRDTRPYALKKANRIIARADRTRLGDGLLAGR